MSSPTPVKLRLKTHLVPILVGLLLILQIVVPFRGWLMLLVVLGGLWLICYLWVRSLAAGISLNREMRYGWTQVGDRVEERFTLKNGSYFPALWLEVQDQSNMPGYDTSRGTGVGSRSVTEWRTDGLCRHRGVFSLGPTKLVTGDPFGVYTASIDIEMSQNLLVLPPIIPLPAIEVASGGRTGEGRRGRAATEPTVSVAGVREYGFGDRRQWIHWPLSLHRNALFVRTFESSTASDWWVILDMDSTVQSGTGNDSSVEHAITLAASLVDRGLYAGKSVGFVTYGQEAQWIPPQAGDPQRWRIMNSLAVIKPGEIALSMLLSRMRPTFGQNASLIIITSDDSGKWIDELLLTMRKGAIPTVLLLDHRAREGDQHLQEKPPEKPSIAPVLANLGVACYSITSDIFSIPESAPGYLGKWNMYVLPTGKVVATEEPISANWRSLS